MDFLKQLKGTKDFIGENQLLRSRIRKQCEETFMAYGYQPFETSILQSMDLLAYKYGGGAEIVKEVYTLTDQGGREIALRYDLTVPFTKVIAQMKERRLPIKRYEIGKVFRNGPVKVGRLREFVQCDVDIVGITGVEAELELVMIAFEVLQKLKVKANMQFNNRKLLVGVLVGLGVPEDSVDDVILSVDKLEKIGVEGVKKDLVGRQIKGEIIEKVASFLTEAEPTFAYFKKAFTSELVVEGLTELETLFTLLKEVGLVDNCMFNPFLARGLTIYTGTVYEIFLTEGSITSAIGSGGRYDKIITNFIDDGKVYPTVGLSLGLDVIYYALIENEAKKSMVDMYIIPLNTISESMKLANRLRQQGLIVAVELSNRKLKNSLNYANKEGIPYVLIVGEQEVEQNRYTVKNMKTGDSSTYTLEELDYFKIRN